MKEIVERVTDSCSEKHPQTTSEQQRKLHDEISDFVAELLSKRAEQLTRFGRTESHS